jgi:DNA-binding MarR family transcriptional regulator
MAWNVNKADVKSPKQEVGLAELTSRSDGLLFLTDEQLRQGIEAMFFAYRGFTADPDRILESKNYGRAHHRAIHFIQRSPGTTVSNLLTVLGVTKQSLNRVLRTLIEDGLVRSDKGKVDQRERHLFLTDEGMVLERELSDAQRVRMRAAYRAAGPQAVQGFRQVLEAMMDPEMRRQYNRLKEGGA